MPPGVETLTNLGTTYLELHRFQEDREYFSRVIELNKNYEYASGNIRNNICQPNIGERVLICLQ